MTVSVQVGSNAPITWDSDTDFDASPTLTIVNNQTDDDVTPDPYAVASVGSGVYVTVWSVPSSTVAGSYTATLSGDIGGEPTTATETIYVVSTYSYISAADFKAAVFPGSTSTTEDMRIVNVLSGVSRAIDAECGRTFRLDASTSAKIIDPCSNSLMKESGVATLFTPDFAFTDTAVVEVGRGSVWTTIDASDLTYGLEREDGTGPYVEITRDWVPWTTLGLVRVTAQWGWPSVPPAVAEACFIQSTRILARKGAPEGIAGPAEWGLTRQPRLDIDVRTMLTGLQKPPVA